jgi:hypothetical protein
MTDPKVEVEVDLKRLGCPFPPTSDYAPVWLQGFKAGLQEGRKIAEIAIGLGGWKA